MQESSIQLTRYRDDIVVMTIDMPGKSANVLTDAVWADLDSAMDEIESNPPAGIIVVSAKPSIYVAGADLVKISKALDWSDQQIMAFCDEGRRIMARLSSLPSVSIAAVHGVCVGGGMELALWCDHRIASDDRKTLFGLPEVKLGLIPGWAGTVRLPRLIGLEPATEMTVTGDLIGAAKAHELGIVSKVVPPENLVEEAAQLIDEERESKAYLRQRDAMTGPVTRLPDDLAAWRESMQAQIDGRQELDRNAPTIVLNHMADSATMTAADACQSESVGFARVWGSAENRGLLHWFFLDERAKKTRPDFGDATPPQVQRIGIVGAGLMGTRIASLAISAGMDVVWYDADRERLARRCAELASAGSQGTIITADSLAAFSEVDLVVEAIVEKLSVKQQLLRVLDPIVGEETFIATNTSTIPLAELATAIRNPARLVGLHFCCPVEPMRLVEIIRGAKTSDVTLNVAIDWIRRLRKTPLVVNDHPGFVVNRLLCPVFNESLEMLVQGQSPASIDAPFREFGFAAGPLEMIDFIGVDTIMYAGETFLRTLPDLVSLNPVLPALVKRGRLGRKSGEGFYRYRSFESDSEPDDRVTEILERYRDTGTVSALSAETVLERLLEPMVAAGRAVVSEGIVDDPRDVDICSVLGATFPAVRGGLLYWADQLRQQPTA